MFVQPLSHRSAVLFNNIAGSGLYKATNVIFNLLIIRYSILLMGEEQYGIWLALLSLLTWFSAFEVGISNGVRNRITTFFADQEFQKIKTLVEKGYKTIIVVYFAIFSAVFLLSFFLPIEQLILPNGLETNNFKTTFLICIGLYFVYFIFFFAHSILLATHKTKWTYAAIALQNFVLLLGLLLAYYSDTEPSLFTFCFWFSLVPMICWGFIGFVSFRFLSTIKPTLSNIISRRPIQLKSINKHYFVIQVATLILFSSDNVIIIQLLSGSDVALYNITFKYFNILIVLFNLILVPYWASFSDAIFKSDYAWISSHIKKLIGICFLLISAGVGMLFFTQDALNLWIGKEIEESFMLSLFIFLSIAITMWNSIFAYFLNSVSKTGLQLKLILIAAIINIPLTVFLIEYQGISGSILSTCIVLLPLSIFLPFQCRSLIKQLKSNAGQ